LLRLDTCAVCKRGHQLLSCKQSYTWRRRDKELDTVAVVSHLQDVSRTSSVLAGLSRSLLAFSAGTTNSIAAYIALLLTLRLSGHGVDAYLYTRGSRLRAFSLGCAYGQLLQSCAPLQCQTIGILGSACDVRRRRLNSCPCVAQAQAYAAAAKMLPWCAATAVTNQARAAPSHVSKHCCWCACCHCSPLRAWLHLHTGSQNREDMGQVECSSTRAGKTTAGVKTAVAKA
jgi:hypothetical protein